MLIAETLHSMVIAALAKALFCLFIPPPYTALPISSILRPLRLQRFTPCFLVTPLPVAVTVRARGGSYTQYHRDWAVPLGSGWSEDKRIELIFDGPNPATVLGIVITIEMVDMAGGQS